MKLNVKYIDSDIILSNDYIFSVEINNKGLFYRFINDLNNIANGNMIEDIYLYKDLNEVNIANRISVIIDYFNIDFNSKKVLAFINNLIVGSINEKDILSINQYYNKILDIILDNTDDINISLEVNDEFDIQNIIKLFKITVKNKDNILDKITLFIDLEKELSINEFIVLVNIKQYLTKEELIELYKYAIYNQIKLLLVDYGYYGVTIENEKKIVIDEFLEEFVL
ncbi:MAG: type II-A CRISPR-associated protein Csn2 [Mollicutes bacterium]|nr:type II-A CRISPR-associated protein Csn2 [Mollicutes bacterium]